MPAAVEFDVAITAARAIPARAMTASDDELLADMAEIEALRRLVDALRVGVAAEVERRSRKTLGEQRLSFRNDARDGPALVAEVARIPLSEARRRVGIGSALAPKVALTGEVLPGRYPNLAAAVSDGIVGLTAARMIVDAVQHMRRRISVEESTDMVEFLTGCAATLGLDQLRLAIERCAGHADPDGPEPNDREQRRARSLKIGATRANGMTRAALDLPPEQLAIIKELLASRRRNAAMRRTEPGGDGAGVADGIDPEWREDTGAPDDDRTRAQQDLDSLMEVVEAGIASEIDGNTPTGTTHEVIVTVTADELDRRNGVGFASGVLAGVSIPVVERIACTNGTRLLVTSRTGDVLQFGRTQRGFSPAQKKAIFAAAGNTCQMPGCHTPTPYLHAHHVDWWHRDTGPTDVENGVALCSFHHHVVHARDPAFRLIRTPDGIHRVPRKWTGPPEPDQRVRTGPLLDRFDPPTASTPGGRWSWAGP